MIHRKIISCLAVLLLLMVYVNSIYAVALEEEKSVRFSPTQWYVDDISKSQKSYVNPLQIIRENLDMGYVTFAGGYNYSGEMKTDSILYEGRLNQYFRWLEFGESDSKNYRISLEVPISITIRQFTVESSPVRTPSFNPGLRAYFWKKDWEKSKTGFWYVSGGFHHYSNGQDTDSLLPSGEVNTTNGSFSSDYVELAINKVLTKGYLRWFRIAGRKYIRQLTWEDFQTDQYQHASAFTKLRFKRFNMPIPFSRRGWPSHFQIQTRHALMGREYVIKNDIDASKNIKADTIDNTNLTVELIISPPQWQTLNWYIRYDYGYDYYNINFQHKINRLQLGIAGHAFDF